MTNSEQAGKKKKKKSNIVFRVSLTVFLICLFILAYILWTYFAGQKVYDDLKKYTDIDGKPLGEVTIDWDSLRAINPDIVGWMYMPDSVISYPVVWRENDDNYYLHHNFNDYSTQFGAEYGCIFLSGSNKSDWSDNSNFVFGHNMYNGTVFSVFSDEQGNSEWFNDHRYIYIFTPQGNYKLLTYTQNKVPSNASDIVYTSFPTGQQLQDYAQQRINASIVSPDPAPKDVSSMYKLFSFSTCSSPDDWYRIITFSDVLEYYDFTDQSKNTGIPTGSKGSIVLNKVTDDIAEDIAERTE